MEKWVCESLRHIYELESALCMAHGNKQSYPHKTKDPPKKNLKGYFSPDLQRSQSQRRHRGSAGTCRAATCPSTVLDAGRARGGGGLRGASVPPALAAIPACTPPAANPVLLHHEIHGESHWQLLARQAGVPVGCGGLCVSANPLLHMGAVKGLPPSMRGVCPLRWWESLSFTNWAVPNYTVTEKHTKLGNTLSTLISVTVFCLFCFSVEPLSQIECRTPFH